jgi:hypothetical protein
MQKNLIIQRPACESMSFDWSDFPIVQQQDVHFEQRSSCYFDMEKPSRHYHHVPSCDSDSDLSLSTKSSTSSSSSSSSKRVAFSNSLEIRTHSIVLGDHPCCKSLPIELGWDYDETQRIDLEAHEQYKQYGIIRRRSYLERKNLLRRFLAATELEQASNNLHHSAPTIAHNLCDMMTVEQEATI